MNPSGLRKKLMAIFLEDLKKTSFKNITISSITARAGISHSAFYYYFKDIYDLLVYASRELFSLADHPNIHLLMMDDVIAYIIHVGLENKILITHILDSIPASEIVFLYCKHSTNHMITFFNQELSDTLPLATRLSLTEDEMQVIYRQFFDILNSLMVAYLLDPYFSKLPVEQYIRYACQIYHQETKNILNAFASHLLPH